MSAVDELIARINYLNIESDKRKIYNKLKTSIIFANTRGNPDIFLLSLTLGFKYNKRKKLKKSSSLFRVNELGKDIWIPLSIGYKVLGDLSIFETKEGVVMALKICEEYANCGIDILNGMMKKPKEFTDDIIREIIKEDVL